ncbi:MAG: rhomboid family intramembrane serine protease [Ancrocorticia sp.]
MVPSDAAPYGVPDSSANRGLSALLDRARQWLGVRPGKQPVVTLSLIAICVAVAFVELLTQKVVSTLIFAPILGYVEPYRFLGSTFLHAGFWHLLFNMYALWLVGSILEPILGRVRFLSIYVLSAVAGNIAVLLTADPSGQSWIRPTVGASGAVFGVFGALFVLKRHFGSDATSLLVIIMANLALGFIPGMNISWQSHVGGLVMGGALMALMSVAREGLTKRQRYARDTLVMLVAAGALVGLYFWGYR